jgi:hypothetical protein
MINHVNNNNMAHKMKNMAYWKSKFAASESASPFKVSDSELVKRQDQLNHTELDFKEPGWAKAARGIHEGAKSVLGAGTKGIVDSEQTETPETNVEGSSVAEISKANMGDEQIEVAPLQ